MMTKNSAPVVILFGSSARGDNSAESDIDILIIEDEIPPQSIKIGVVEIQKISKNEACAKAKKGDLFIIHILCEGKVISDVDNYFLKLKENLVIKKDYSKEKNEALALASFLELNWNKFDNISFVNKRIAWSIRTVVISILIESGRIIFSPKKLSECVSDINISDLIDLRRSHNSPINLLPKLREFIFLYGGGRYLDLNIQQYETIFKKMGNSVALSTFKRISEDVDEYF